MILLGEKTKKYIDYSKFKIAPFGTPMPLHGVNPRNMLGEKDWDLLKKAAYRRSNYKCAICGDVGTNQGFNHPVEAHEIWDYDFDKEIQIFGGVVALCPICHKIYHWSQLTMAHQSGSISTKEYDRITDLKFKKIKELHPGVKRFEPDYPRGRSYVWHDGDWKSDFSLLKELGFTLKPFFDTKYSGYFELDQKTGLYKKSNKSSKYFKEKEKKENNIKVGF